MIIRVEDIKDKGLFLEFKEKPDKFPALKEMTDSGAMIFLAPLQVHLRAIRVRELVEVEGTVESLVRVSCSRCLKEFASPVVAPFAVTFTRNSEEDFPEDESDEVELTAEEMGLIPFEGEQIDLREVVQEQVIMGLPVRPLCDEKCRGLCPHRGKDLNEGECGCSGSSFSSKFAKLKDFKIDDREPGKK